MIERRELPIMSTTLPTTTTVEPTPVNLEYEIRERISSLLTQQKTPDGKSRYVTIDDVTLDSTFELLGADSLDIMDLLAEVEEEYRIDIDDKLNPNDSYSNFTVGMFIDYIKEVFGSN